MIFGPDKLVSLDKLALPSASFLEQICQGISLPKGPKDLKVFKVQQKTVFKKVLTKRKFFEVEHLFDLEQDPNVK